MSRRIWINLLFITIFSLFLTCQSSTETSDASKSEKKLQKQNAAEKLDYNRNLTRIALYGENGMF